MHCVKHVKLLNATSQAVHATSIGANVWCPSAVQGDDMYAHCVQVFHWPLVRALLPVIPETWRPLVKEWGAVVKVCSCCMRLACRAWSLLH